MYLEIMIASGVSGGHIYPALALADGFKARDERHEILFVGNVDRMEAKEIPSHGYAFKGLRTSGLSGGLLDKAKALWQMQVAYRKAKHLVDEFKPDLAIGFGGYVSAPVMMAAHHKGVKVMIHEQNSIIGAANRLCIRFADAVVVCYEKCLDELAGKNVRLLGNPRAGVVAQHPFNESYYHSLGLDESKPLVLIVMGSLGSTSVNDAMVEALNEVKSDVQILYVTGKTNYETMKDRFKAKNIKAVPYVDQVAIMDKVDCIVCRAGATTAAEITAFGIPAVLIPSPYVAMNHQFYNAKVLVDKKCAFMIEEKDLTGKQLYEKLNRILNHPALAKTMRENMLANGYPNACIDMIDWAYELVGEKSE